MASVCKDCFAVFERKWNRRYLRRRLFRVIRATIQHKREVLIMLMEPKFGLLKNDYRVSTFMLELSEKQQAHIRKVGNVTGRNKAILKCIEDDPRHFQRFLDELANTDQNHVVEALNGREGKIYFLTST